MAAGMCHTLHQYPNGENVFDKYKVSSFKKKGIGYHKIKIKMKR
jgi:hypothetical protein